MPIAVNNIEDTKRFDLKSAPPDGFVVLRRMTYGQVVQRRALMKLSMEMSGGKGRKGDFKGEMAMASVDINNFEFKHCIVEHNLEKADGVLLNLASPVDLQLLDPRVGQEIEGYITQMNNFEAEEGE